jgi:hypothetical protein
MKIPRKRGQYYLAFYLLTLVLVFIPCFDVYSKSKSMDVYIYEVEDGGRILHILENRKLIDQSTLQPDEVALLKKLNQSFFLPDGGPKWLRKSQKITFPASLIKKPLEENKVQMVAKDRFTYFNDHKNAVSEFVLIPNTLVKDSECPSDLEDYFYYVIRQGGRPLAVLRNVNLLSETHDNQDTHKKLQEINEGQISKNSWSKWHRRGTKIHVTDVLFKDAQSKNFVIANDSCEISPVQENKLAEVQNRTPSHYEEEQPEETKPAEEIVTVEKIESEPSHFQFNLGQSFLFYRINSTEKMTEPRPLLNLACLLVLI